MEILLNNKLRVSLLCMVLFVTAIGCSSPPSFNLSYDKTGKTFKGKITAENLKKNSAYLLSINGKEDQVGNEELKKFGIWQTRQGYYDFDMVYSDDSGNLSYEFEIELPASDYHVTFLVKDEQNNQSSIYSNDFVRFTIMPPDLNEDKQQNP